MGLATGLLAGFGECLQEILAIDVIKEDIFMPVAAAHKVVDGTGNSIRG